MYKFDIHEAVPKSQTGLVLGAYVYPNGQLCNILQDRLDKAIELYYDGKIEKIILSGDNGQVQYDEVNAMKEYMLSKGIPEKDLFLDHAGFDTYDSVYRAQDIFQIESISIITQNFHLPRALFIAREKNIDAIGISSDVRKYENETWLSFRESLARIKAYFDIAFNTNPTFRGDKIPITGDSKLSWD